MKTKHGVCEDCGTEAATHKYRDTYLCEQCMKEAWALLETLQDVPSCPICHNPLGSIELNLGHSWHLDCMKCQYCGGSALPFERVAACLEQGISISHAPCADKQVFNQLREKKLPILKQYLSAVNNDILKVRTSLLPDSDILAIQELLVNLKETAVNVSWILKQVRTNISIKDSEEFTEKIRTEKKVKADVEAISQERKNVIAAERADPALRDRRKAIEGLVKGLGISLEAATAMIDSQKEPPKVN